MDKISAGVSTRWVFNGLPFGVEGLFLVKADEGDVPIRMLGEISPRTRLGDSLSGDWETSLVNGASSADSVAVDKVAMPLVRVSKMAKQKIAEEKELGDVFQDRK